MIDDPGMAAALAAGLDDAKRYARIESDADDDGLLALIGAAAAVAEGFLSQAIIARTFEETVPAIGEWRRLARMPMRSTSTLMGDGWVRVSNAGEATRVIVTYEAGIAPGWAGLPDMIRQGIIRLVAHLHSHRDARDGRRAADRGGGAMAAVAADAAAMRGELSGRLRTRVIIERREDARDAIGAASGAWITMRSAWVEIAPDTVGPMAQADARAAMARWAVTMRFEGPLPAIGDRVLWAGRDAAGAVRDADPRVPDQLMLNTEEER